jgi:hypothetical protein
MKNVISLASANQPDAQRVLECMEVLDQLRAKLMSGEVAGFAAVALDRTDECTAYVTTNQPVSRLRMMGAVANLQHCLHAGEV